MVWGGSIFYLLKGHYDLLARLRGRPALPAESRQPPAQEKGQQRQQQIAWRWPASGSSPKLPGLFGAYVVYNG